MLSFFVPNSTSSRREMNKIWQQHRPQELFDYKKEKKVSMNVYC
jgi:hypothetical protein